MRAGLLLACVIAVAAMWPRTVSAGSELERDERAARKYALSFSDRWDKSARGLCVCRDHPANPAFEDKLGLIVISRTTETIGAEDRKMIEVRCQPFGYDLTTEERSVYVTCDNWVPLAK